MQMEWRGKENHKGCQACSNWNLGSLVLDSLLSCTITWSLFRKMVQSSDGCFVLGMFWALLLFVKLCLSLGWWLRAAARKLKKKKNLIWLLILYRHACTVHWWPLWNNLPCSFFWLCFHIKSIGFRIPVKDLSPLMLLFQMDWHEDCLKRGVGRERPQDWKSDFS